MTRSAAYHPLSSGYRACSCPDCLETTIAPLCWACQDAGCDCAGDCLAPGAYGADQADPALTPPER